MATATHHHSKKAGKHKVQTDFCDAWNRRMDDIGAEKCSKERLVAMIKKPSLPSSKEVYSVVTSLVAHGAKRCSVTEVLEGLECVDGKWIAKPGYEGTI